MAPTSEDRIRALKAKRIMFKLEVQNLQEILNSYSSDDQLLEIRHRLDDLESEYITFAKAQPDLDIADTTGELVKERAEIKNDYMRVVCRARKLLQDRRAGTSTEDVNASGNRSMGAYTEGRTPSVDVIDSEISLPKFHLPQFSGSYEGWPGFSDQFKSAVHENQRLSDCKRLMYLRSCLRGEAARLIESLENSAANYTQAWELLEKRYNKPAVIVANHVRALFDVQTISKPSHHDLRQFVTHVESHYRALKTMNQPSSDTLLIHLCLARLDNETNLKWKEHTREIAFPKLEELLNFLHNRCEDLEPSGPPCKRRRVDIPKSRITQFQNVPRSANIASTSVQRTYATQTTSKCNVCSGSHHTHMCDEFKKISVPERVKVVKGKRLCFNCLRRGHSVSECTISGCRVCKGRHHTLLHTVKPSVESQPSTSTQVNATCLNTVTASQVLLSTAIVDILDNQGRPHSCRVFLDSCAQSHFLTSRFAKQLKLSITRIHAPISGMNRMTSRVNHSTRARIRSRTRDFTQELTFLVVSEIANLVPSEYINRGHLGLPHNIQLADPDFDKPSQIDGLLGAQIFWHLLCIGQIKLSHSRAILQKTLLGWIVAGESSSHKSQPAAICNVTLDVLQNQISKFWELEEGSREKIYSAEESACESHYRLNTRRDSGSGRYIVRLPFKENVNQLGESYNTAMKRFLFLERSLCRNKLKGQQYVEFMREYENLGHMTKLKSDSPSVGYYLPHHAVEKKESLTTKIRVVFDASARTSSGLSLNDTLMTGPTIQEDLFSIVTRFRTHRIVLVADITKMYRQIELAVQDRQYHKILWREHPTESIKTYILNTVTYGTASAPYLAIRSLHQLALDEEKGYPRAATVLKSDFYVDDLLTGADTFDEAVTLRDELIALTSKGGFELRQWSSNNNCLLSSVISSAANDHTTIASDELKKTLGLYWNRVSDSFGYSVKCREPLTNVTKRNILARIAQLFDPLGLLGPIIVRAKLFMQQLWQLRVDWDESIPLQLHTSWKLFESQLSEIQKLSIPRRIIADDNIRLELNGFCDASEKAYGACLYLLSVRASGINTSHSICSKSRVAPLKTQSLPRLELCAAVLLVKLYRSTVAALKLQLEASTFWTDSMIVLHWIETSPHTLKTFVANRVRDIQEISKGNQWRHVPSSDNPADCLSRGLEPRQLNGNELWYLGPSWLRQPKHSWPHTKRLPVDIPERRTVITLTTSTITDLEFIERFSSIGKLQRVMAYCLRFCRNAANWERVSGSLQAREIEDAHNHIIKLVQKTEFANDIISLSAKKQIYKGKLVSLNPFLDEKGLLRVGGRIVSANVTYDKKHPILLPYKHHLTTLLIREYHLKHFHAGTHATLNAIRQTYWPINGLQAVKTYIHKCIRCNRANPKLLNYQMGYLPKDRVVLKRPFLATGIDYCGPFFIKERRLRNTNKVKAYAAIFVCFSTKAVHLELVSDLTTDAFLAALKRFFARRGKASDLYTDNGTNFVGANRELRKVFNDITKDNYFQHYTTTEKIAWHFIPPYTPHFGGLWEATVKSVKRHLVRVVGKTLLTYEAMSTYLIQVEAILNSRPLTPVSSDPNDLTALTPGHFLIGDSITSIPETNITSIRTSRLSLWQHVQQMRQHFWNRWHKEFLHVLTVRRKWHGPNPSNVEKGALVMLKKDNVPPMYWHLGRIVALHPGPDNVVRVVTVKTLRGEEKRSVKHISPLPLDDTTRTSSPRK